ncbi:MAG: hypothetical protein AAB618_03990 [Patescibacteria group bacterium]
MWLLNIAGWKAVNGLFGLIGLVLVIFLTLSPKIIQPSAAVTGLIALFGKNNPVRGALQGPLWIVSIAKSFLYGFLFFATFLTFWSFENSPLAFWGIFLVAMMLFIWRERYPSKGDWAKWLEWTYIVVCATALLWSTFGDSWNGRSFDPNTGAAMHMVDPTTGKLDSLSRTPAECSVRACFSEESGAELVPMNPDQALSRNVTAWPGLGAETVRSSTGLSIWLVVLLVAVFAGAIWLWSGKGKVVGKPVVLAAMLVAAGWAGYTYAWPAVAGTSFGCPGTFSTEDKIVVRRGCKTEISGTIAAGSNLMAMDGRFDGLLTQYVDIEQPFAGFVTLKPNKGFPAGVDQVEVRILTAAEAVRRTEFIAEEGAGDNADKLFGKFKP